MMKNNKKFLPALFLLFTLALSGCANTYADSSGSEPTEGSDHIFCETSLDGYTAALEMSNILNLPDESRPFYSGQSAIVRVTDPEGRQGTLGLFNGLAGVRNEEAVGGIWASCAEDSLKIQKIEKDGKTDYVLMVRLYSGTENGALTEGQEGMYYTQFISCNLDKAVSANGEETPMLCHYSPACYNVSDGFALSSGSTFTDPALEYDLVLDPEGCTIQKKVVEK